MSSAEGGGTVSDAKRTKHSDRFAKVISPAAAKRYRDALEQIASDTIGKSARQIAERHIDTAREALMPGYSKAKGK
jgi:hypothetical protein